MAIKLAALLVLMKLITVVVSSGSGNAGGLFAPVLFIGAMLGGTVGGVAHHLLPKYTGTPAAYALVGMGAAFAGIVRTPMTSVVLVFEVTRDYSIIVPLMIANLVSYFIAKKFQPETLDEALALQDGIHLPGAETHQRAALRRISQVMHPVEHSLPDNMTVREALEKEQDGPGSAWLVMADVAAAGVITGETLRQLDGEGKGDQPLREFLDASRVPHVHGDQSFDTALERMGSAGVDLLPVVSRLNVRVVLGVVRLVDILNAYRSGPADFAKSALEAKASAIDQQN
jgi:CIC family chloride channel protein